MKTTLWTKSPFAALALTCALLSLAGCKKADKPVKETFEAALSTSDERMDDDGSFYRSHSVSIPEGYKVSVTLTSSDFDTYLLAVPPDGSTQRENDDCVSEDPSKGSCLNFVAHVGGDWQIVSNSVESAATGLYRMTVEANKP